MKMRASFVSNSSSTSFIAVTDNINTSVPVRGTNNTLEDFGWKLTTMKELIEWIDQNWIEFKDDENIEDQIKEHYNENSVATYRMMKKEIESGRAIITGSFADDTGSDVETDLRNGEFDNYINEAELLQYYSE